MTTSQEEAQRAGAFSSMLSYRDHKKRSAGGGIERVILPSVNGSVFQLGQSIDITIPGNTNGFMDTHSSYLKFKINYNRTANGAGHRLKLGTSGVFNLFKRIELIASSTTVSSIDEYSKLANLIIDCDMSDAQRNGAAAVQYGMGSSDAIATNHGAHLDGGDAGAAQMHTTEFTFLPILTALFSATKYLPLMGDELRLRFTLNEFSDAFIAGERGGDAWAGNIANVTISPVELVMYKIHLDDVPMALVQQATENKYSLVLNDFTNSKGNIGANDTSSVFNTGFSYSSLARVLFAYYPNLTADQKLLTDSERHKITRDVQQYCFNVSGKNIPAQKLKGGSAETLTENKASLRILGDFQHGSSVNGANFNIVAYDAAAAAQDGMSPNGVGTRHYEVDLETLRNHSDENGLYSGISTIGKTTSVQVSYNAGGTACEVNMWAEHQIGFTLDMNTTRTWQVVV